MKSLHIICIMTAEMHDYAHKRVLCENQRRVMIEIGSVKNVGVEDTPRISEPLSFFEKTLFSSAPTGVSHR